jgi:hypothetical protein
MIGKNGKIMMETDSIKNIILIDSNIDISKINFVDYDEFKIISFDFETHKLLNQKDLDHLISDELLSDNNLLLIQKNAYSLSQWYDEESIKEYLEYENVNLGSLVQSEFINILVNYSKRFQECLNIIKKFGTDANYICGGLNYEIMNELTTKLTKIKHDDSNDLFFPLDSLNIKMKIGIKSISKEFNVPQNIFKRLKKISEESSHFLSNSVINSDKKTILLSEFSTLSYEPLLSKFSNSQLNTVIFNRRQPAVWNKKTFSIIKNSKIIVENETTLIESKIKTKIKEDSVRIEQKISNMFENSNFFNSFFSLDGNSFWKPFSLHFIKYFKERSKNFIREVQISKQILEKYDFSLILILSEVGPNEKILLQLKNSKNTPKLLLQHGLINDSIEGYEHNVSNGVIPIESNGGIVWGKVNENYLKKIGIPSEKIHTLGTPLFDNLEKSDSSLENNDYVLFATSGPTKEDSFDLTVKTIEKNFKTIKKIAETVVIKHKMKLIVKLHPSPDEFDPTNILKKINPEIKIIKTGKISELIKNCKILIVVDESTSIIYAHLLNKPVLSISVKTPEFGIPTILKNGSCIKSELGSFDKDFSKIINDQNTQNEIKSHANESVKNYLSNTPNNSKTLISFLEKYVNET